MNFRFEFEILFCIIYIYIGGSRGAPSACPPPAPQQDPFLSFSHMFSLKSVHVGGWRPQTGRRPPRGNPGSATDLY